MGIGKIFARWKTRRTHEHADSSKQDLGLYWDPKMAALLESWGEGNAWNEALFLFSGKTGKAWDVA